VRQLTLFTPDEGAIERYYRESMVELTHFFYDVSLLPVNIAQSTFELDDGVDLIAAFYDARMLDKATLLEARAFDGMGRDTPGEPLVYFTDNESERTWRLAPTPSLASTPPLGFGFFGVYWPKYNVCVLHTILPDNAPDIFDLPLALRILSREFSHDSAHQDIPFAERCQILYIILIAMLTKHHQKAHYAAQ
jgi:hypothetical protein